MTHRKYDARIWAIAFMRSLSEAIKLLCAEMLCYAAYLTLAKIHTSVAWIVLLFLIVAPYAAECMAETGRKRRKDDILPMLSAKYRYDRSKLISGLIILLVAEAILMRYHYGRVLVTYGIQAILPAACAAVAGLWAAVFGVIYAVQMKRELGA